MPRSAQFVDKLISQQGSKINKFHAIDSMGQQAYYFVLMDDRKERSFYQAINTDITTLNLQNYGRVIASCYGEKPSDDVKKLLKDKYGFDV
ncbi:MAG: hypothetical protein ACK5WS_06155 [Alphaproteobacteria bacterium]|jgi:hypothetical protein|nr:hypothetical protein [Candidatus Jidaibacter sp.]